ncbi:MAG: hypothetical protein PHX61_02695 [Alphaproteobacteria bacterium]|nr:hypothetical protein [Alphaproteobacteria bacterium]
MLSSKKPAKNTIKHKVKTEPKKEDPVTTVTVPYKTLTTFLKAIEGCIEEAVLSIRDSELSVKTTDNANIYMVVAQCPCKTEVQDKSPAKIGISVKLLNKALLHAKGCNVTMSISESKILLKYGRFSAQVSCVDINALRKEPNDPKMSLNNEFSLPGKYLDEICNMVSSSGKVRLLVENKVVTLRTEEGDLSVTEVVGTTDGKGEANSLYPADYLKNIAKAVKGVDCTVRAGVDHPVHIFAEVEDCNFQFFLAPRIESE